MDFLPWSTFARIVSRYGGDRAVRALPCTEQFAAATRGHWGVENQVHYILDVSMHEDASRVRKSPTILSILRSFALNILRFNKVSNVADALWRNAMNLNRVLAYNGI